MESNQLGMCSLKYRQWAGQNCSWYITVSTIRQQKRSHTKIKFFITATILVLATKKIKKIISKANPNFIESLSKSHCWFKIFEY